MPAPDKQHVLDQAERFVCPHRVAIDRPEMTTTCGIPLRCESRLALPRLVARVRAPTPRP